MLNGDGSDQTADPEMAAASPLIFTRGDAERWRGFSGDNNPIHFDVEQARLLEADGLVVHGMVALLPIRERIARGCAEGGADDWKRFRVMFRRPIPQDRPLELSSREQGGTARFGLRPAGAAQDHIRAQYGADSAPPASAWGPSVAAGSDRIEAFVASYGEALPAWMALEAAIFAELVQSETDPIWEIVRRNAEAEWGPLDKPPMVVHASHTVWHRDSAELCGPPDNIRPDEVGHAIGSIAVDSVADQNRKSLSCRIPLEITVSGARVLQIEVGLLVIKPPDANDDAAGARGDGR